MRELTPEQALTNLKTNSKNFLGTYPIAISNAGRTSTDLESNSAGEQTVYIQKHNMSRPGSFLGKKRMHQWYLYSFEHKQPKSNPMTGDINPEYTNFQAYYVPISWSDDPNPTWCDADNDPVIMITGQLSGCSFVVKDAGEGGELRTTHLQPTIGRPGGNVTGDALNTALKRDHEDWTVFGKSNFDSDTYIVNVIGVRDRDKGWQIFAQKRNRWNQQWTILDVAKVYP